MIRIAFVITELEVGGAEQAQVRLATGLDRSRFLPVVYSLAPLPAEGKDQLVRALADAGIEFHSLGATRWWHFLGALKKLTAFLHRQQPHIVQSFLFHANVVGTLAARQAKVPHILLGIRVADPSWWRGLLERSLSSRVSATLCVSQAVADFCRQTHKFPAGKLIVIPNGIDVTSVAGTNAADLASLGVPGGRRALSFIGRLDEQKDPQWLLEIAQAALPQLPEHDLLVVGGGPLQKQLQQHAQNLNLAARIHFLGWRSDALAILAASDALLLTSRYEGLPNVVLEAMALAKPVVASRTHGVEELLGPAADEQSATHGDTPAFVAKVTALCQDPQRATELGRINRARAAERFSLTTMIQAYARLYEGLAAHEA